MVKDEMEKKLSVFKSGMQTRERNQKGSMKEDYSKPMCVLRGTSNITPRFFLGYLRCFDFGK